MIKQLQWTLIATLPAFFFFLPFFFLFFFFFLLAIQTKCTLSPVMEEKHMLGATWSYNLCHHDVTRQISAALEILVVHQVSYKDIIIFVINEYIF